MRIRFGWIGGVIGCGFIAVLLGIGYLSESEVLDAKIFDDPVGTVESVIRMSPDFSTCDSQDDCRDKLIALEEHMSKLISKREELVEEDRSLGAKVMFGEMSYSQFEAAASKLEREVDENTDAINEARANEQTLRELLAGF